MKLKRWLVLHMSSWRSRFVLSLVGLFALSAAAKGQIKDDDFNIGIDSDTNQLSIIWNGEIIELPPIEDGPLSGWGIDDPGFITLEEPFESFLPPETGANIVLEVLSFDSALKAWEPGFGAVFHSPGDLWDIGPVPAHEHPFWHIDSADSGYVPGQTEWDATFRILDTGSTGYAPSEPVTVTFVIPEPSTGAFMLLAAGCGLKRSRRRSMRP